MKSKKAIIIFIVFVFLVASPLIALAKTRVYASVSLAGVVGGGLYWYFSAGTQISQKINSHKYAFLPRLYSRKIQLHPGFKSNEIPEEDITVYLPLYSIRF